MKKYKITVILDNGDKVDCRVEAENQSVALGRLMGIDEFCDFLDESGGGIKSVEIDPVEDAPEKKEYADRFLLQASKFEVGRWVCVDTKNNIVVSFQQGDFNGTKNVSFLEDFRLDDHMNIARYLREMGDYLFENYKEIL